MIIIFFLSNIRFGQVKEMSQGEVSFMHPKHMLLKTVIKTDHEYVPFSETSGSQIYLELASISKNLNSNFRGFVVLMSQYMRFTCCQLQAKVCTKYWLTA